MQVPWWWTSWTNAKTANDEKDSEKKDSKEKSGKGGFPDLTGDNKVTQADILKAEVLNLLRVLRFILRNKNKLFTSQDLMIEMNKSLIN